MKKLNKAKFIEAIGQKWVFLTVEEAVRACNYMLHRKDESEACWNNV